MKNTCHNRQPFKADYLANAGPSFPVEHWNSKVRYMRTVTVPNRMSRDCQYSLHTRNDPGCEGCRWKREDLPAPEASPETPGPATSAARTAPPRRER